MQTNSSNRNILHETETTISYPDSNPTTPGVILVESKTKARSIFELSSFDFKELLLEAKFISKLLCERLSVRRCAMITLPIQPNSFPKLRVVPLHGLAETWKPMPSGDPHFDEYYAGYCDSKNGPRMSDKVLSDWHSKLSNLAERKDFTFYGDLENQNLFARIVRGQEQQWCIWENENFIAVLTPFPNTPGFTVVVPRTHWSSNIFSLNQADFLAFVEAGRIVAQQLIDRLQIQQVCMVFEGFEIDYAHIKLIPVIGEVQETHGPNLSLEFSESYRGYVTTLNGPNASNKMLEDLHRRLS